MKWKYIYIPLLIIVFGIVGLFSYGIYKNPVYFDDTIGDVKLSKDTIVADFMQQPNSKDNKVARWSAVVGEDMNNPPTFKITASYRMQLKKFSDIASHYGAYVILVKE